MDLIRSRFTVADLVGAPDDGKRYEILEGDLAVSPSPNRQHQRIVQRLHLWFCRLEEAEQGQVYLAPFDVVLDQYNVVEPDVLFIRSERLNIITDTNVQGAPDLVVEVLSSSTRARDLGIKAQVYRRFRIAEYWIVDPDMQTLAIYGLTPDGYQVAGPFRRSEIVASTLFPGVSLAVADLFDK